MIDRRELILWADRHCTDLVVADAIHRVADSEGVSADMVWMAPGKVLYRAVLVEVARLIGGGEYAGCEVYNWGSSVIKSDEVLKYGYTK